MSPFSLACGNDDNYCLLLPPSVVFPTVGPMAHTMGIVPEYLPFRPRFQEYKLFIYFGARASRAYQGFQASAIRSLHHCLRHHSGKSTPEPAAV